jgi:phospholipase/carboxylesterase
MTDSSIVVSRPASSRELILLFHGVGATATDLEPLARLIAQKRPGAMVVSIEAPHPSSFGRGREWFSVAGVTEENRPARVAAALPAFESAVRARQEDAGVSQANTILVGFSQGAIMSLESTQGVGAILAHRIISISGRFAVAPRHAPVGVTFRFVHGERDPVIDPHFAVNAADVLQRMGADATATLIPNLGHGIDPRAAGAVIDSLQ